jgi:hypothetical protein
MPFLARISASVSLGWKQINVHVENMSSTWKTTTNMVKYAKGEMRSITNSNTPSLQALYL